MNALDCSPKPATLRRRVLCPHHKQEAPKVFCIVDPSNPEAAAKLIVGRIKATRRAEGAGSYLYIDTDMQAYVISEQKPAALEWVRSHFPWLVGRYLPLRGEGMKLSPALLAEDVASHLLDLARAAV